MGGCTYIFPSYNIRLNWYGTYTDLFISKQTPNKIEEHRIMRLFPTGTTQSRCIDYQDDTPNAAKIGSNIHFTVDSIDEAIQKAFDIFHERFDKKVDKKH